MISVIYIWVSVMITNETPWQMSQNTFFISASDNFLSLSRKLRLVLKAPRFGLIWSVIKYKCLCLPSEQADRIRWIWTLIRNNLTFVSNIYLIWSTIRHIINQVLSPSPWIGKHLYLNLNYQGCKKHINFNLIWSTSINSSFPIYCISDR